MASAWIAETAASTSSFVGKGSFMVLRCFVVKIYRISR